MTADSRRAHWDGVYTSRPSDEVSWFEREPATSLRLVEAAAASRSASVVDVGAGTSSLVDHLVDDGFTDVTLLDVSPTALDAVRVRLGGRARAVTFVVGDVLAWEPAARYDVWHDRAVFHFLTDPPDRARYVATAAAAVRPGGLLVIGAFAADGPTHCSGLPVCGYAPEQLAETFGLAFVLVAHEREVHRTPSGAAQPFTWVVLRRVP
jgi:SAM-dependent methyltransferase